MGVNKNNKSLLVRSPRRLVVTLVPVLLVGWAIHYFVWLKITEPKLEIEEFTCEIELINAPGSVSALRLPDHLESYDLNSIISEVSGIKEQMVTPGFGNRIAKWRVSGLVTVRNRGLSDLAILALGNALSGVPNFQNSVEFSIVPNGTMEVTTIAPTDSQTFYYQAYLVDLPEKNSVSETLTVVRPRYLGNAIDRITRFFWDPNSVEIGKSSWLRDRLYDAQRPKYLWVETEWIEIDPLSVDPLP